MTSHTRTSAFLITGIYLTTSLSPVMARDTMEHPDASSYNSYTQSEMRRLEQVDPPIRPDPVGNAIIGGVVAGTVKGSAAAVGAEVVKKVGTAIGIEHGKDLYKDRDD
ncbi:hypothetical protein H6778_00255 [Candidatus Nomurabacteria bacterium]|nr:hypothetical protein [Candidatus Nomurabacteria bacterium]